MIDLPSIRTRINQKLTELAAVRLQRQNEYNALEGEQARNAALREALAVAQTVAQQVQEEAHHKIADIVSTSLRIVFEEPYQFRIIFEQKRGRTEARLVFERNGHEVDPMTASGGGVVSVAAFALRLSALLLSRPAQRKILFLDEPMVHLSKDYRPRVAELLTKLSKDLSVQLVMVTHADELAVGTVVKL